MKNIKLFNQFLNENIKDADIESIVIKVDNIEQCDIIFDILFDNDYYYNGKKQKIYFDDCPLFLFIYLFDNDITTYSFNDHQYKNINVYIKEKNNRNERKTYEHIYDINELDVFIQHLKTKKIPLKTPDYKPKKLLFEKLENIKINISDLIENFRKNEKNLFSIFNLDSKNISKNINISELYENVDFEKALKNKKLKKGKIQDTKDFETLLVDKYVLKFFFIYKQNEIELEEPIYIVLQYFNKEKNKLSDILLFLNDNNIEEFYRKLTNSTIEIDKDNKTYIYNTSNSGNNWDLKNPKYVNKKFKDSIDDDELSDLIKDKKNKLIL
jgi:hypothetical protein